MSCGKPCNCPTYRDHLLSVGFAAAAMPSRRAEVARIEGKERVLAQDLAAYRRLRRDGTQPPRIDGSHVLEARAETRAEVETGVLTNTATGG